MNTNEFALEFKVLRTSIMNEYFKNDSSFASKRIKMLNLNYEKNTILKEILNTAITDALYTVLLGLDGCAQIGNKQNNYIVSDEDGNIVAGNGIIEEFAYKHLQIDDKECAQQVDAPEPDDRTGDL